MNTPEILTLTVLLVIAIFVLVIWFLFFKKKEFQFRKRKMLLSLSTILLLFSSYLLLDLFIELDKRKAHKSWPTTTGQVITAKIIGERAIRPLVVYSYELDSEMFIDTTSLNPPMFGGKRKKHDVARKLIADYPVGGLVSVHYNPDDPEESDIVYPVTWDLYGKIGFIAFLFMIATFSLPILLNIPKEQSA